MKNQLTNCAKKLDFLCRAVNVEEGPQRETLVDVHDGAGRAAVVRNGKLAVGQQLEGELGAGFGSGRHILF